MPWCPECHNEYEKGIRICSDCGKELIDKQDTDKTIDNEEGVPESMPKEWRFLINTRDQIESDVVESLLRSEEIPLEKQYDAGGSYQKIYLGGALGGVNFFVPSDFFETAKGILEYHFDKE